MDYNGKHSLISLKQTTKMENVELTEQEAVNNIYQYAADLLVNQKQSPEQAIESLKAKGLSDENAQIVVGNLQEQISTTKKARAKKDMLYGALWCVGGIIGTVANTGFIFWGAIIFGGIQFFKGLMSSGG